MAFSLSMVEGVLAGNDLAAPGLGLGCAGPDWIAGESW